MSDDTTLFGIELGDLGLDEESLIAGAMFMAKVIEEDGTVSIRFRHNGLNWLERLGMNRAIQIIEQEELTSSFFSDEDD